MALVPAICEEVFFRGFLQTTAILIFKNRHGAVILIAVIFSILHGDIFNFIPRFALGVFLGYLFLYSRHIIVPILAHALHNTWVVVCSTHQQLFPTDLDTIGTTENLFVLGIGSVLILTGATIYLAKKSPLSQWLETVGFVFPNPRLRFRKIISSLWERRMCCQVTILLLDANCLCEFLPN